MRVAVIGATGNVGTSVLAALEREARVDEIVAVARRPPEPTGGKMRWREADVTSDDVAPLLEGAGAVIHLVGRIEPAEQPEELHAANVEAVERVGAAARETGVDALVYGSSTAAYSAAPKDRRVDESWPLGGSADSPYARQKAEAERVLDRFEGDFRVVRLRFDAVFKREAGEQARAQFLGRVPRRLIRPDLIPVVPNAAELRFQAVHADDLAQAFRLAVVEEDARGAYNVAAEPVLDARAIADLFDARVVPAIPGSIRALRAALAAAHRAGLSPLSPSWLDFVTGMPLVDTTRIRTELRWEPRHDAGSALLELVEGMRTGAAEGTAALAG